MIAQKTSFAFFGNIVHSALGYISLFFVARYMGPEALGIIGFAHAYVNIFVPISELGFGWAHVKRVSEGKDIGICNGTYLMAKALLTLLMALIIVATILVPKIFWHKTIVSETHEAVLYIILISTIIISFSRVFTVTFQARKETAKQIVPFLTEKIVIVVSKVIVALVGLGVILLAGASVLSALVGFLLLFYLFRDYPVKKPNMEYVRSYIGFALPVMFIGILPTITQNIDKVLIQAFWTSTDVGYYVAVQRISIVLSYLSVASMSLLFPTISSHYSRGEIASIRILSNRAERYLSMILFPAVVLIFLFSLDICRILLGTNFVSSAPILVVLSIVALVNGVSQPYIHQLSGTNNIILSAKISGIVFVMNLVLNFLFIPNEFLGFKVLGLGAVGAAYATLISICIGVVLFRLYAYKITRSKPNSRVLYHLAAAVIMYAVVNFISNLLSEISWYLLILLSLMGIGTYVFILAVFREFTVKDFNLFLKVLNPMQLMSYARHEVKSGYSKTDKRNDFLDQ